MTTVLRVTGATKRFGATQALDGAEVSLERGQLLLLLGPNGAGKTTLIRAIAGRVRLDDARPFGEDLTSIRIGRRLLPRAGRHPSTL